MRGARLLSRYAPCRLTAAAVGPNSGKIVAHDFLGRCSWGSQEGGWDCETGEGGEARMSNEWLGGDRLAATGRMDAGARIPARCRVQVMSARSAPFSSPWRVCAQTTQD